MTEHDWYARLGQKLREERHKRGWTLYDVAAIVGTSGVTISRWERGTRWMKAYQYLALQREGLL